MGVYNWFFNHHLWNSFLLYSKFTFLVSKPSFKEKKQKESNQRKITSHKKKVEQRKTLAPFSLYISLLNIIIPLKLTLTPLPPCNYYTHCLRFSFKKSEIFSKFFLMC